MADPLTTHLPRRTGLPGSPPDPQVLALGIVGDIGTTAPDVGSLARSVASTVRELASGSGRTDGDWSVLTVDRNSNQEVVSGPTAPDAWARAITAVPDSLDRVLLSCGPWGSVDLAAPSQIFRGPPVWSITAAAEVPTTRVEAAAGPMLAHLEQAAGLGALTGYVHADSLIDPYTRIVTSGSRLSADDFAVEVHGYYWSVLLGPGHLQHLGGLDRVFADAPCRRVEHAGASRDCVLTRLTESPADLDEQSLRPWRAFLAPVLRDGYPTGWEDVGARRTPLQRPVWLFEGAPAPRLVRRVLEDRAPTAPPLPIRWTGVPGATYATIAVATAAGSEPSRDWPAIEAVVHAWFRSGRAGRLLDVAGSLISCESVDGQRLAWEVRFDAGIGADALVRLAAALGELDIVLGNGVLAELVGS